MEFGAKTAEKGTDLYRLRVVAEPIIPYLQWELHSLKLRAECGELIRILPAAAVRQLEDDGELPEVVTLCPSTAYHILYDADGVLAGGVKVADPQAVGRVTRLVRRLYGEGEDLAAFFERGVAPLPPPRGDNRARAVVSQTGDGDVRSKMSGKARGVVQARDVPPCLICHGAVPSYYEKGFIRVEEQGD